MLLPIKPVDYELTRDAVDQVSVAPHYKGARVLVRWHGVPVGTVQVPVVNGHASPSHLAAGICRDLVNSIGTELISRTLQRGSVPNPLALTHVAPPPTAADGGSVSVVICTRDRPLDLAVCLAAIARLDPPPREVLVVDNAPKTEATAELVQHTYPQYRYIREPTPGLDHARNRGIREAVGDVVAFTDDDVVVDAGWVGAIAHAFAVEPRLGLLTGLIEPYELETEAQVLFETYGGFGRGYRRQYLQADPSRPLAWTLIGAGQLGAGANMAIRHSLFAEIGLFDPALDVGTPTRGGGDHEIFYRLIKSGWLCLYEPAALVRHRHRRTLEELRKLLFDYGHATRCFFDRVVLNFPEDKSGVQKLQRWWWNHWAARRWWRASTVPTWFPRHLVGAEIHGFIKARGAYQQARQQIVRNETNRPDSFRPPARRRSALRWGVGFVVVDVADPLASPSSAAEYNELELVIQRRGQSLGSVRMASLGQTLSPRHMADVIARDLWVALQRPIEGDNSGAWAALADQLATLLQAGGTTAAARLPDDVSATIIVATCDRPDDLRRCLRSLMHLRTNRPLQIIVVDNRPASGLAAPVVAEFPRVELVQEARAGSSYARNAGIAAARGEITLMTDDDMEVAPDWLEQLVAPFARTDVLAVTGNTLPARVETEAEKNFEAYGGFARGFVRREYDARWFHRFRRRAVPTWKIGGSGNSAYRTEIFSRAEIGVFDERLGSGVPTGVGEDTKLFYDILHAGYTIVYEPSAIAWHYHRVSMDALRRQLRGYSKGHVAYHLVTWLDRGDMRGLVRVVAELPLDFARRIGSRLRRRRGYPWRLLLTEITGTLAGPWSLWAAHRNARRLGPSARPAQTGAAPPPPSHAIGAPAP